MLTDKSCDTLRLAI